MIVYLRDFWIERRRVDRDAGILYVDSGLARYMLACGPYLTTSKASGRA